MNAKEELQKRINSWKVRLGDLSYQKIQIEKDILSLEAAVQSSEAVLADMNTEEAINQAKKKEEEPNNV
jgi:hypothetical protein